MSSRQQDFVDRVYDTLREMGATDTQARLGAAQAALETGYGRSVAGNNFYGIKATPSYAGPYVTANTWEEENGQKVSQTARFRAYDDPMGSVRDYAEFMGRRFPDAFNANNFRDATKGLKAGKPGGYATDSSYAGKLSFINSTYDPNPLGLNNPRSIPTPMERPEVPTMVAADPFSFDAPDIAAADQTLSLGAPDIPVASAYVDEQKTATPFDAVMQAPDVPDLPAPVSGYVDQAVSAPNYGKTAVQAAPIDDVTETIATPEAPDLADPAFKDLQSQYGEYGAGRALKDAAANLALDVADATGKPVSFNTTPSLSPTAPAMPKTPSIEDVAPEAPTSPGKSSTAKSTVSQPSVNAQAEAVNRSNAMKDTKTLAGLQQQDNIMGGIVSALGGVLGSAVLGPIGGILGAKFAPSLFPGLTQTALNFYPTAPINPNASGGGSGYDSLSDAGRDAYNSSGNFRDAVDAVDEGRSQGGLW